MAVRTAAGRVAIYACNFLRIVGKAHVLEFDINLRRARVRSLRQRGEFSVGVTENDRAFSPSELVCARL